MSLFIDHVTMPPKSQEVSQIQHLEQLRNQNAEHEIASQFQNQVKQSSEQTVRRAKTENDEKRYREKKKGNSHSGSGKKNQNGKQEEKEPEDNSMTSHFDMRI